MRLFANRSYYASFILLVSGLSGIGLLYFTFFKYQSLAGHGLFFLLIVLYIAIILNFPLLYAGTEYNLAHVIVLTGAMIASPTLAMWAALFGVWLAAFSKRYLERWRTQKYYSFITTRLNSAFQVSVLVLPIIGVNLLLGGSSEEALGLSFWQTHPWQALATCGIYLLIYLALLLIELALRKTVIVASVKVSLATLFLLVILPLPFIMAALLAFPQNTLVIFGLLASAMAAFSILINHANLVRLDLERRTQEFALLNQISELTQASLNMDEFLQTIYKQIFELTTARNFYIAVLDEETSLLSYPIAVKHGEIQNWPPRRLMDRLTDRVVRDGQAIFLPRRASQEMGRMGVPVGTEKIQAWLGVPLIASDRVFGCLAVSTDNPQLEFSIEDLQMFNALGEKISVLLANAILYEQAQNRAQQLEALNQMAGAISASLDLETVFTKIAIALGEVSTAQASAIFLHKPNVDTVSLVHAHGLPAKLVENHAEFSTNIDERTQSLLTSEPVIYAALKPKTIKGYHQDLLSAGFEAYIDLPLVSSSGTIGYLSVYFEESQVFKKETIELLETFASHAAIAVHNARQYTDADQKLAKEQEKIKILDLLGQQISATLRSDELFRLILVYALDYTDSPWGSILIYNPVNNWFDIKIQQGYTIDYDHILSPVGIAKRALDSGQSIITNDVTQDPEYFDVTGGGTKSQLIVPIYYKDQKMGLITTESPELNHFSEKDEVFVNQIAERAALAILNATLFDEAQRRYSDQASLYLISTRLVVTAELTSVMSTVLQAISATFQSSMSAIYLLNPSSDEFLLYDVMERENPNEITPPEIISQVDFREVNMVNAPGTAHPKIKNDNTIYENIRYDVALEGLLLPIVTSNQVLGLIFAHVPLSAEIERETIQRTNAILVQGAIAIQNALLFADVRRGRDRLTAVLNTVGDGVLMVDADGTITLANHPMAHLMETTVDALTYTALTSLSEQALRALNYSAQDTQALLTQPPDELQEKDIYPYQDYQLERSTAPVFDSDGHVLGWVIVLRDMTDEVKARQARQLITETIVHDLRSPISTIRTTLDLIQDVVHAEMLEDPVLIQSLSIARRSTRRLLQMISSLLDIGRLEAGNMALNIEPAHLDVLVITIFEELMPQANEANIVLRNALPEDLPKVEMDANLISRVLTNLIDNALKFSPEGGVITLSAESGAAELVFSVMDNGPGVPLKYREEVFQRFGQIPNQRGRRRGTGLGLTFCRLAIEAHAGQIWVESGPEGAGAIFKFTLPLKSLGAS